MADDLNDECKELKSNCMKYDILNNITDSELDNECWKNFFDLCYGATSFSKLALVISLAVIAVLSIGANSMVCIVFFLYRELRLLKHYFVINLAVVEIVIAAILIPLFSVAQLLKDKTALCRCELVFDIACGTASILSLSIISLERYVAVVYCLQYNSLVTHRKAVWCIIFIWLYSLIVSSAAVPSLIESMKTLSPDECFFMDRTYVTFVTFASFLIPISIMVAAYWKIFLVARTHARRIRSNEPVVAGQAKSRIKRELKSAKTLTIIMGSHIICWCPLFAYLLVYTYCPSCWNKTMRRTMNFITIFLLYCNSLANPLIYSGINRQFRAAIKRFILRRNNTVELIHTTASARP